MRLVFHGELKKMFGEDMVMHVRSAAEAIEGYSRQQPNWPRYLRISAIGPDGPLDTPEKLLTNPDEVHLIPAFVGGGGKWGAILLGAAMIGAAFLLPGIGVAISAALKMSLLVSGGLMMLQGVMGFFMKAPNTKGISDPEQSKYLGVNKNTTQANTPIPMGWGRMDVAPHWLSLQSDSINLSHGHFPATP